MCGIIAYTGKTQAVDMLLAGLFHLEFVDTILQALQY